jgi:hypothetical protein
MSRRKGQKMHKQRVGLKNKIKGIAKAALALSMSLVMPLTSIPTAAAENTEMLDPDHIGSISITCTYFDENSGTTKPVTGGNTVGLYKVADVVVDNGFKFVTDERFAGAGEIPLGSIICYESVYGDYCTEYVKAGARALCVITNDAWWGDTPGYRQHLSYSCLRAIETRRDIARCANTGISGFIDQRGEILSRSGWWVSDQLEGKVNLNSRETFYVRHGDIIGRVSAFAALLLLLALIVRLITRKH